MLLLGWLLVCVASVTGERVYLESLNNDGFRRSVLLGQPETLNFRLLHRAGAVHLNLRESVHLNVNAPIFVNRRRDDGKSEAVQVDVPENRGMKFFQDIDNGAYVRSVCYHGEDRPCYTTLEGNILINGKEYKLVPATYGADKRHVGLGVPHHIEELERTHQSGRKHAPDYRRVRTNDYVVSKVGPKKPDGKQVHIKLEESVSELERLISRIRQERRRNHVMIKRQTITAHGIEILLAVDHLIYKKLAHLNPGKTEREILAKVREYYVHVVNGVDIRYASIQDPEMSFYVTIVGFSISTREDLSPWMKYDGDSADADAGLDNMVKWRAETIGLPEHDHAALMTGAQISVAGIAFLSEVCKDSRVSVNADDGFFQGAGTLAHELGHNLGALHDSGDSGGPCAEEDKFVMNPANIYLDSQSTTLNPWRFSSCSIKEMKEYVKSLGPESCTLTRAKVWDKEEYEKHRSSLPGKLYTEEQQCVLLRGPGTKFCSGNKNTAAVCRTFGCSMASTDDYDEDCEQFVAARGTPCGEGMICFEGICTRDDSKESQTQKPEPETTDAPKTTNPVSTTDASTGQPSTTDRESITTDATNDESTWEPTTTDATNDESTWEPTTTDATNDESTWEPTTNDATNDESTWESTTTDATNDESTWEPTTTDATNDESSWEPTTNDATNDESTWEPTTTDATNDESTWEPGWMTTDWPF